jgi:hypothetical protein
MALGVSDVREVVERVCARPDVLDACRHRDRAVRWRSGISFRR